MIVVVDDADRENEGDLVLAAETVTENRWPSSCHDRDLRPYAVESVDEPAPQMVEDNTDPGTAFTVSVDHIDVGTGVSARDRARRCARWRARAPARSPAPRAHLSAAGPRAGSSAARPRRGRRRPARGGLSGVGVIGEIVADDGSVRRGGSLGIRGRA
jgi:3,4-dihydroxy 2-butanone 4-phosphate synthase/GTP cyclohydrolase II